MQTEVRDTPSAHCEGHLVHFYEDPAELAQTVSSHLLAALDGGATALVIATEEHRLLFEQSLSAAGLDLDRARHDGRWRTLDATATVRELTAGAAVDPDAFDRVVGTAVREAARGGAEICAYGEMVDLLWAGGNILAALELESLWNDLQHELDFSLLCSYREQTVTASGHRQVAELHSGALRRFAGGLDAPREARHFLEEVLRGWGCRGEALQDAELVISELATNAVTHARSPFLLTACSDHERIRIGVRDESRTAPKRLPVDPACSSGRGLQLVSTLSREWGVELLPDGKTVWAELQSTSARSRARTATAS